MKIHRIGVALAALAAIGAALVAIGIVLMALFAVLVATGNAQPAPTPQPATAVQPAPQKPLGAYTDARYLTGIAFGQQSHWIQPWRAYLETLPAHHFVNGTGIMLNNLGAASPDLVLQMLAKNGIRHGRIEISWGSINVDDESKVNDDGRLRALLLACRKWNVRPLILLNAHHGAPGPTRFFERTVTAAAPQGSRAVQLDDVSGLVIGRSGLSQLTDYWAAEALVTAVDANTKTVTLSKPLPKAIAANARVPMATLRYRPFSPPGSADYIETIGGWKRYVATVTRFVTDALQTTQVTNNAPNNRQSSINNRQSDKGFDLEVWNEMSFGSNFITINAYYEPKLVEYNQDSAWSNIVKATAEVAQASPQMFSGIALVDGFSNTLPWQASSTEPARVSALSHHPYAGRRRYPDAEPKGTPVNVQLEAEDKAAFKPPAYEANFPEYHGTWLQTETLIRDMGPLQTDIYGVVHGRYARPNNPCWTWITEVNYAANEDGVNDGPAALALKAKTTARYFCFYLGKGVQRLYLYAALPNDERAGDTELGIVSMRFRDYSQKNTAYPKDDAPLTSPALLVTRRIVERMKQGMDAKLALAKTRPLQVVSVTDTHHHFQFAGEANDPKHPPLWNRDVFVFTPFQVNARRFVIPYYVMTRDVKKSLPPEQYSVTVRGLRGATARVAAYDPITDKSVPVAIQKRSADTLQLQLAATDYPRLLTVQE